LAVGDKRKMQSVEAQYTSFLGNSHEIQQSHGSLAGPGTGGACC
jgi:hypothetical protein